MAKDLSQSEIDALLSSLRRAQEDAGSAEGDAPVPFDAAGAWGQVGEDLIAALADLIAHAWQGSRPGLSVARGDALPPGFSVNAPSRGERLGTPLSQRLWFFWEATASGQEDPADRFLTALAAHLPSTWTHDPLEPSEPFPEDGVLLPFRGVTDDESIPLTVGLEARQLRRLRDRLSGRQAVTGRPEAVPASRSTKQGGPPVLRVNDLEVEVSVYVGGGLYTVSSLSALRPGAVLPLDTEVGEPAVIAIAGRVIALGEVMLTRDDTLAVRLTKLMLGDEGREAGPVWLEQAKRVLADPPRD